MNQKFPIETQKSIKKSTIFSEDLFTESACEYSSYKFQSNKMYSTLITRLARFIILILMMIGVWLGKSYGTPSISVDCLNDPIHNKLEFFNSLILDNSAIAQFFQISSSLLMDSTFFVLYSYWVLYVKSSRLILSTVLFYVIRAFSQMFLQMRFPEGYYWSYPGFPSYVVPYGHTSDFFFSGHCGFLMICALEWYSIGKKKLFFITILINVYMAFVMLIFRVHYAVDVTTGLMVSHYAYMIVSNNLEKIDGFWKNLYVKSYRVYCKSVGKQYKEFEGCELT